MKAMRAILTPIFCLAALGCVQVTSGKYFSTDEAEGISLSSSKEMAIRRLGEPVLRETVDQGTELWVYQYTQVARALLGEEAMTNHLTLRFENGLLRDWRLNRYVGTPRDGEVLPPDPQLAWELGLRPTKDRCDLVEVYWHSRDER